jgi:(R,R)-butanediol dehydrogenase / meso-butanediol dehydrogenase / diacetyl reductase
MTRSQAARSRERHARGNAGVVNAGGQIPLSALITRTEPLARAEQAFLALESGAGVMKVLIDCQAEPGAGVAY